MLRPHRARRATLAVVGVLALAGSVVLPTAAGATEVPRSSAHRSPQVATGAPSGPAFTNPVSRGFADTFADPAVIRGKDGWWYAFGTSDPLREGEGAAHRLPVARSADLVDWEHVGDAFTDATLPTWAEPDAGLWAPDIRYVDGEYRLYYVVTETTVTPQSGDNAIGMATAPTPAGPWKDSGRPVVEPRPGGGPNDFLWTFDPSVVTDRDGSQWIFYGSYYGGVFAAPLSPDGRQVTGAPTRVAIDNKFEGAYPWWHDGFWYLFVSTANCCAGPATGYSVQVGRSRSLTGPYVDQQGVSLTASRAGGTPSLVQNGNRWIGAGHNAVVTDLAGQDWFAYHAIDRADPYLDGTDGINERPMLLDRLDWVDGWPVARAGAGPSEDPQAAPVTSGRSVSTPADPAAGQRLDGRWQRGTDEAADTHLRSTGAASATSRATVKGPARAEADLRSGAAAYGLSLGSARLTMDPTKRTVTLRAGGQQTAVPLPASFAPADWHSFVLRSDRQGWTAEVTHARLSDPVAVLHLDARGRELASRAQHSAVFATGAGVGADNLSLLSAATSVRRAAPDPVPSRLDPAASDEFDGAGTGPGWTWVRPDPEAVVSNGSLRWPTQGKDLVGPGNDAAVLLRDPGDGQWAAVTKVDLDVGTDTVRNFQQAGLIAYAGDDSFARLSHVAIWNTRQTEFGHELPYAGRLAYGGTIVGPPAATTWLRITHRLDPQSGEHLLRGWSSRDGRAWVKGGVWTLPAGSDVRIGLVSHGGQGAIASFDWFRIYRP